jgi:tRNA A-37 threonylcarbamoyl transferase component Bud32
MPAGLDATVVVVDHLAKRAEAPIVHVGRGNSDVRSALLVPRKDFYEHHRPTAADTLLVIEVSDATIGYDSGAKARLAQIESHCREHEHDAAASAGILDWRRLTTSKTKAGISLRPDTYAPRVVSMLSEGTVLAHRYRVKRCIGEGGMSEVYLVEELNRPSSRFAAKVLKPEVQSHMAHRFQQEARTLASLRHPGIVQVHGGYESRGILFFILAHVEGTSLPDRIRRGPLDVPEALKITKQVLEALDYAHQRGVIHRDVKPSNILLDVQGNPLLCDFGIARQLGKTRLTRTGTVMGTPHYMSPEQIQTPDTLDHRTDLYSAGVVLYEMLTGRTPFGQGDAASDFSIQQEHIEKDPPDPCLFNPRIDRRLREILMKAMRKRPGARFQGGMEFKQALEQYGQPHAPTQPAPAASRGKYRLYVSRGTGHVVTVPRGFLVAGLLQGPLWFFANRLTLAGIIYLAISALLLVLARDLYTLLAFFAGWGLPPAWFGSALLARRYRRLGYEFVSYVDTPIADESRR